MAVTLQKPMGFDNSGNHMFQLAPAAKSIQQTKISTSTITAVDHELAPGAQYLRIINRSGVPAQFVWDAKANDAAVPEVRFDIEAPVGITDVILPTGTTTINYVLSSASATVLILIEW
jgi:hypothetical protein